MKHTTLTGAVIAFLKGGDEAKLARFERNFGKFVTNQQRISTEKIDTLKDKVTDAKELLNETILNVQVDEISTTEGSQIYCAKYLSAVQSASDAVDALEREIKAEEAKLAKVKALNTLIYSVVKDKEDVK